MTVRFNCAGSVQELELPGGVPEGLLWRERRAAGGIPPGVGKLIAGFQNTGVRRDARLLLCG